jgi:hypothetical protein
MAEPVKLTVEIQNKNPVELVDLNQSLLAFADEYKRHLERTGEAIAGEEIRLYVRSLRTGSIIVDLEPLAAVALPFVENANAVFAFLAYLKNAFSYLLGELRADEEKPQLERSNLENLVTILEPVAKDPGAQLNINSVHAENVTISPVTIIVDSRSANAIQNRAQREKNSLKEVSSGPKEKVLLHWFQARNDPKAKTGDKAIIESIHKGAVKTRFANEGEKASILDATDNLFNKAYVVDVTVETINGKPQLYKVTRIHESFDIAEQPSGLPNLPNSESPSGPKD